METTMQTQGTPPRAEMMPTEDREPPTQREPAIARWRALQTPVDPKRLS